MRLWLDGKGLIAGATNLALGLSLGASWPGWGVVAGAALLGFVSYGASLTLFVLALRHLGTARTGAYFSVAPFFGALLALVLIDEPLTGALLWGGGLMAIGVLRAMGGKGAFAGGAGAIMGIMSAIGIFVAIPAVASNNLFQRLTKATIANSGLISSEPFALSSAPVATSGTMNVAATAIAANSTEGSRAATGAAYAAGSRDGATRPWRPPSSSGPRRATARP